jgi:hypothetical protein
MDHAWAAEQLHDFVHKIRIVKEAEETTSIIGRVDSRVEADKDATIEDLILLEPVMRELMNAAQPGLGNYEITDSREDESFYWIHHVLVLALRAIGIHTLGAEARKRMRPDSPDLVADQLHPWVWEAAMPLWAAGSRQEAVQAAARSVNARLQQKLGRRNLGEASLCREAFTLDVPIEAKPRLRFPGDRDSITWRSRQLGVKDFGAGCFQAIRNPAAHEHSLDISEQVALEQLTAFSLLARWIEECSVDAIEPDLPI